MPADSVYPLLLQPVYQTYVWGGSRLKEEFGRSDAPEGVVAESWEVTDRPDGMSVVKNGPLAGKSLRELIEADRDGILGHEIEGDVFPLLIKILDAAGTLSVQVHPDNLSAIKYGGEAKTEMWYVLDAKEDAKVYCGLNEGVTAETFRAGIEDNTLEGLLKTIPVEKGDAIFVPGGRVHAIGEGCLLLEVQQNSNTTYRIYDWGRLDANGVGRELHVDQALQVTTWRDTESALHQLPPADPEEASLECILENQYFVLDRLIVTDDVTLENDGGTFEVVFAVDGDISVRGGGQTVPVKKGSSVLLPAGLRSSEVVAERAGTEIVLIRC